MSVKNSQDNIPAYRFPKFFLMLVLAFSLTPIGLNVFGVDFSSTTHSLNLSELANTNLTKSEIEDAYFHTLTGGLQHALLEWSAVMAALLTIILAFSHYAINKDITMPIIGIALFCSGIMDAFHTLAALRLVHSVTDASDFIPFTWALSRGFNALIMIIGALICIKLNIANTRVGLFRIILVSTIFGLISYILISYAANSPHLPETQFPDAFITRPYDVAPLFLFLLAIPVFWTLYKKTPNLLTAALIISVIPEIILEMHMAFGSSQLFDNHFNIAHFLKILAYLIPFIGLVLDYVRTHRIQYNTQILLEQREKHLQIANEELEEFAYRTSHDLRSPLISCIKLLEMITQAIHADQKEKAIKSINIATSSLKKLENLVGDILILTRTKNLEESDELLDIRFLTNSTLEKLSYMDDYNRLEIETSFLLKEDVYTKNSRVQLIVENLISNAIKYQDTDKERSFVKISAREEKDYVVFSIEDNGLGIPANQQQKLFTMFKRFHPKVSFGSGLGLYMMKKSADVINGQILYEDTGQGSIFKLFIPKK